MKSPLLRNTVLERFKRIQEERKKLFHFVNTKDEEAIIHFIEDSIRLANAYNNNLGNVLKTDQIGKGWVESLRAVVGRRIW